MSYAARIVAGVVEEVVVGEVDLVASLLEGSWVDVPATGPYPGPGWLYDGNTFAPPPGD